jgi:hypothetical protein
MTESTNEVIITELEQQIARILSGNGEVIGDLINLMRAKQTEIDGLNTLATVTKANLATLESRVNELDGFLNENWEEMNHLGINEDIAKIFKLEIEQETKVNFTITGTATIKHPRGTDLEDMDMSDLIDADILTQDHTYEVQGYEIETITGN